MTSKDLWDLAVEKRDTEASKKTASQDSYLLFVGSKSCGKTTAIYKFLEKDDAIKPSVALEYVYGRRTKSVGASSKNLVHVWELGGGIWLSKLVDSAINIDTIENLAVLLYIDLTAPKQLILTFETLVNAIKSRIDLVVEELKRVKPDLYERITEQADKRIDPQNPDRQLMQVFPVPLVLVGAKYDAFAEFDPQERSLTCRTLRFLAHYYGATLIFTSIKQDSLAKRLQTLLTHFSFSPAATVAAWLANLPAQTDVNKPILIAAGSDSFSDIGKPPITAEMRITAKNPLDLWRQVFTTVYQQENPVATKVNVDPTKDAQYAEPAIDSLRLQKDEELEKYRRLSERRMKEIRQQAQNEGLTLI